MNYTFMPSHSLHTTGANQFIDANAVRVSSGS
jgi:hypothetical protein